MSTATALQDRPVITAWTAVSPFGIGRAAFADGLREGRQTVAPLDDEWQAAAETACLVPDFRVREVLGKKGTRSMDRVTGLAITAVSRLLDDSPRNRRVGTGEEAALVLGTTTGSVQSQMDFTRDSLTGEKPYFVDPARFPNAVMNCAAGQSAIWHQLKGPNTTIAGGHAAGLYALNYARRLLRFGRARTVLCGAVEEFSHARSWLDKHTNDAEPGAVAPSGEGCGLLLVERGGSADPDQPVLAEVLAVEMGIAVDGAVRPALRSCLERALRRAEVGVEEIWAVATGEAPGRAGEEEWASVEETVGGAVPSRVPQTPLIGDTGAAAAAFQIAGVLARAENDPEATGRVGLITSVDRDGAVGCTLLRFR
ncbi:beta-ketoacyl synthase N-terminal-like domain-containing protein [Streptomyces sp. NBRC 109706]|uniref:beta-ketoacyl synthase N-terminal-like domain-containing protein n=1 Tax=Streptomyces sp. NBRC 109706 TaxID=1550035 RepID=UPI0007824828|nr:beta-ketoacyl synthase N-terminal-like domain-containing protein [Streptomyces sp. NBRC 109706]